MEELHLFLEHRFYLMAHILWVPDLVIYVILGTRDIHIFSLVIVYNLESGQHLLQIAYQIMRVSKIAFIIVQGRYIDRYILWDIDYYMLKESDYDQNKVLWFPKYSTINICQTTVHSNIHAWVFDYPFYLVSSILNTFHNRHRSGIKWFLIQIK